MQKRRWAWRIGALALLAGLTGLVPGAVAQDDNLLANAGLERPYYAQGAPLRTVPQGWNLWVGAGQPESLPHTDLALALEGAVAWKLQQGARVFTAAAYQVVEGLEPGTRLRATASGRVFTCDDAATGCIIAEPPYRRSDPAAGAILKVGLDPAGGTDPLAEAVQWSAEAAAYDAWAELSVTATARAESVTVFLYMTQAEGLAFNQVYWDRAALVTLGADALATASPAATDPGESPPDVPPGIRPDGSVVHIVRAGDTLSGIVATYSQYGVTLESIAALNDRIRPTTRFLTPGQEIVILPPGSVDPATGWPVEAGETPAPTDPPPPSVTPEPGDPAPTATTAPTATVTPTDRPAPTAAPSDTPAPTGTPAPTNTPAPSVTPTNTPTRTPQPIAELPLAATQGMLCVSAYEDTNLNGAADEDEPPLPGAQIALAPGEEIVMLDDAEAARCLELPPGEYAVTVQMPDGYGPTGAEAAAITLASGREVRVAFGGAEGYEPPDAPSGKVLAASGASIPPGAVAPLDESAAESGANGDDSALDRLYDQSGYIMLGLAGIVAAGGMLLLLLRRPGE